MPKKDEKTDMPELQVNLNLATLFVDNLIMTIREDGFALLRLLANLPEGLMEQGRFMVHQERLKAMIDVMCSLVDYYPVKAKPKKKTSPKKAAS